MKPLLYGPALNCYNLCQTFRSWNSAAGTFGTAEVDGVTFLDWANQMERLAEWLAEHQDKILWGSSMDSKASVGRVVHYQTRGTADGVYPSECRAAMVTATADTCPDLEGDQVSLYVFFQTFARPELSVPFSDDHDQHSWHWPERVP